MSGDAADVRRRRPRRTRFSGRRQPLGSEMPAEATEAAKAGAAKKSGDADNKPGDADNKPTHAGRKSGDPAWVLGPLYQQSAPEPEDERDPDERVDDLELGSGRAHWTSILGERMAPAVEVPRRTFSFLLTSPGRLTLAAVVLIIAILAAGLSMSQSAADRQHKLGTVSSASEPQANAAQNLYSALTIADAAANTWFSRGGPDSAPQLRDRYNNAIAQASLAGTRAAAGITDVESDSMNNIATVQRLLPVYTGLVESARANARQGHPVGVAYLAEASGLMRSEILPAAAAVYDETSRSVAEDRSELTGLPLVPLSGLIAAVVMLVFVQWRMTRRTGRMFNPGLTAATALMVVAFFAVSVATMVQWTGTTPLRGSYGPVQTLTEARITAQQARAAETLALVRRQPGDEAVFDESMTTIGDLVAESGMGGESIDHATEALDTWRRGHVEMQARLDQGDYAGAVDTATVEGTEPYSSADAFAKLDRSLQVAIADARLDLRSEIEDARQSSATLSAVVMLLSIGAAIFVVVGFRNRLLEYL